MECARCARLSRFEQQGLQNTAKPIAPPMGSAAQAHAVRSTANRHQTEAPTVQISVNTATVVFRQNHASNNHQDASDKTLVLAKQDGREMTNPGGTRQELNAARMPIILPAQ
jgi:hypothetical protein